MTAASRASLPLVVGVLLAATVATAAARDVRVVASVSARLPSLLGALAVVSAFGVGLALRGAGATTRLAYLAAGVLWGTALAPTLARAVVADPSAPLLRLVAVVSLVALGARVGLGVRVGPVAVQPALFATLTLVQPLVLAIWLGRSAWLLLGVVVGTCVLAASRLAAWVAEATNDDAAERRRRAAVFAGLALVAAPLAIALPLPP